jgi:dsDNA-binding SOS-regulon protein
MTLRAYREGDELKMTLTPESEADYYEDIEDCKKCLQWYETYTCVDENENVCGILCFYWQGDKTYNVWALFDKDRGYKTLRDWKRLVDIYRKRGNILYTVSIVNERQDKMHKFYGFEKREMMGDKQVWVS